MKINLKTLEEKVKQTVPTATTAICLEQDQIIVGFTNRQDVEIALLTPYAQAQLRKGFIEDDYLNELLRSVKNIANYESSIG